MDGPSAAGPPRGPPRGPPPFVVEMMTPVEGVNRIIFGVVIPSEKPCDFAAMYGGGKEEEEEETERTPEEEDKRKIKIEREKARTCDEVRKDGWRRHLFLIAF